MNTRIFDSLYIYIYSHRKHIAFHVYTYTDVIMTLCDMWCYKPIRTLCHMIVNMAKNIIVVSKNRKYIKTWK